MSLSAAAKRITEGVPSILGALRGSRALATQADKSIPLSKLKDSFNDGTSVNYLEELEEAYRQDPNSVDKSWASFFRSLDRGISSEAISEAYSAFQQGVAPALQGAANVSNQTIQESMRLIMLIRAYQVSGHFASQLDPLGLQDRKVPSELNPASYGFSEADLDREFFIGNWNQSGFLEEGRPTRTLREVLQRLKETYCGSIGYEYMHIPDRDKCNWIRERIETIDPPAYTKQQKLHVLNRIAWSDMFETFLANKFSAAKRFGLEGAESMIPGIKAMIDSSADLGVEDVVIGMPHRGRLNVLANVVRKPMSQIFCEFAGKVINKDSDEYIGSGDVKYHLGTSYNRPTANGKSVHLSLVANPSHLEAVNTVVLGKVRAKQFYCNDTEHAKSLPILLHGDGAFSGQGIVYETLAMSGLPDYSVGGTIHVVVNNQVAFTTDPKDSRSSPYCTDVAKSLNCPIFHVNGDDVESVIRVSNLAAEWRAKWHSDVVIDIVCYRKYGHNEIDEPMFTQPLMYKAIKQHKPAHARYVEKLISSGVATQEEITKIHQSITEILNKDFEAAKSYKPQSKDWLSSYWSGFKSPLQLSRIRNTGVSMDILKSIGEAITKLPEDFQAHRQLKKVYELRRQMIESGTGLDWAMAEAMAFATLLSEGNHVRLSGQDVERGTFSHRHSVVHDQNNGQKYVPLDHVYPDQTQGQFSVSNSNLSEFGVLGYELGYSMENPNSLVMWEAQFGDFANGAQIIFDQFLSSGEAKWLRQSGLVCMLPHGYDGQGPEHSSARLERFLQMSDENPFVFPHINEAEWFTGGHLGNQIQSSNWQVVNCTTPANYFHCLRRQVHRQFRKPLIVMSPKNLLRHPACKSPLSDFNDQSDDAGIIGVRFKRVIADDTGIMPKGREFYPVEEPEKKRIVFCTGKVFYDLHAAREKENKQDDVAIVRIEQLAPFPFDLVLREIRRYPNAEIVWSQEEHMNMGAYSHVLPRFETCLRAAGKPTTGRIKYAGRAPSAATATGYGEIHAKEQAQLISEALNLEF
uniref:2-oxoglutarate dehydrogenase, mitochondrial n=1 Tax=Polytomella parva TaxID=51329 RepID=A0A7S0YTI5_9CHLO|mmetsp:Transcript_838/g.1137  ORF Transcript_838/g.1137 Transcript_838/m.1137 type:complete len:1028 (+) Transcript_838:70-3153(+)|eukprot:CAMPEP_0175042770 /NCGR_PEP_ID=MMETSP0052_2-20121109/2772_1 /TAXON_ID=51329 ORGANISM="Polytomella parva, Strain SAG 63-3" /NCGR_SAMPLE_ID=MMETSP0052_2 /ASSEMBLY_ACC=CAM_ASM_000194 /LENGTH=1027 /DNA_ID=CAMNT_0016305667 /DNA_START=60 /DNA_END=3146 /DNA_ORIENTATION=-